MTRDQYWNDNGIKDIQAAVGIAGFSKEVEEWIWPRKRVLGEVY